MVEVLNFLAARKKDHESERGHLHNWLVLPLLLSDARACAIDTLSYVMYANARVLSYRYSRRSGRHGCLVSVVRLPALGTHAYAYVSARTHGPVNKRVVFMFLCEAQKKARVPPINPPTNQPTFRSTP